MNIEEAYEKFPTKQDCINYLEGLIWKGLGPICPYCKSRKHTKISNSRHHCTPCNTSYSVLVGTVFHNTKMDLQKWVVALEVVEMNKKITCRGLAKEIRVTKETALLMINKIKKHER